MLNILKNLIFWEWEEEETHSQKIIYTSPSSLSAFVVDKKEGDVFLVLPGNFFPGSFKNFKKIWAILDRMARMSQILVVQEKGYKLFPAEKFLGRKLRAGDVYPVLKKVFTNPNKLIWVGGRFFKFIKKEV